MSLVFETFYTDGLAQVSYLVGDDDDGVAAVFDPRADVEIYLEVARQKGVSISHIFETHIHADLVSGSRELADRTGTARIFASSEGGAEYGFKIEPVKDGDEFKFGALLLTARHTPGRLQTFAVGFSFVLGLSRLCCAFRSFGSGWCCLCQRNSL